MINFFQQKGSYYTICFRFIYVLSSSHFEQEKKLKKITANNIPTTAKHEKHKKQKLSSCLKTPEIWGVKTKLFLLHNAPKYLVGCITQKRYKGIFSFSLLDNAPNLVIRCVIQKRYLWFLKSNPWYPLPPPPSKIIFLPFYFMFWLDIISLNP